MSCCSQCIQNPTVFLNNNTTTFQIHKQLPLVFNNDLLGRQKPRFLFSALLQKNIFIPDAILHHCWLNRVSTKLQSFQELIELMKITPRTTWNKKTNIVHILKYLTWTLNVNVNLLLLTRSTVIRDRMS